jgi:hypothetical protein
MSKFEGLAAHPLLPIGNKLTRWVHPQADVSEFIILHQKGKPDTKWIMRKARLLAGRPGWLEVFYEKDNNYEPRVPRRRVQTTRSPEDVHVPQPLVHIDSTTAGKNMAALQAGAGDHKDSKRRVRRRRK